MLEIFVQDWPLLVVFLLFSAVIAGAVFSYGKTVQSQIADDTRRQEHMRSEINRMREWLDHRAQLRGER